MCPPHFLEPYPSSRKVLLWIESSCYGECPGVSNKGSSSLSSQGQEELFLDRVTAQSWSGVPGCNESVLQRLLPTATNNRKMEPPEASCSHTSPLSPSRSLSKWSFKCSYQFMPPEASASGQQIWAETRGLLFSNTLVA